MISEQRPPVRWVFWAILGLLLIDRFDLLCRFGFQFTDNDQVLFWMGARDYSHGIFHEPCLYGQNYNYMLESLLAAPFVRLGVPYQYLLPGLTSVLALAPYLALAFSCLKRDLLAACVFVALPILLPSQFAMLTSMSRGFVTGICFLALFPLIDRLKNQSARFLAMGMAGGLAFVVNPNVVPALAALVLARQLRESRRVGTWLLPMAGAVPFFALNYLTSIYYANHPPIHSLAPGMMIFQPRLLLDGLKHLDRHFAWLCPVIWPYGDFVLVPLLALTIFLATRRRWPEAVAMLAASVITVLSLGFPKIHDGDESIGFAYSRMFLAVPLIIGIGFSFCADLIRRSQPFLFALLGLCVAATAAKAATLGATVNKETAPTPPPIAVRSVAKVRADCATIRNTCRNQIELVVALPPLHCTYADASFYCVAGEMMFPDYPRTLIYGFERRSWRTEVEMSTVSSNILFIGGGRRGWQQLEIKDRDISEVGDAHQLLHRVHNGDGLTLRELMRKLKPVMELD